MSMRRPTRTAPLSADGRPGPVVVLVGPPGSGKSTVGARLAELLGVTLRDTDEDVERVAGTSISEVFVNAGEPHFRTLERAAVQRALAEHRGVLALGGGAVLADENRAALAGHPVVFLRVSMPVGVQRTGLSSSRPLLVGVNPRATFKALLDARLPLYREVAMLEIDTDPRSPDEVAAQIADRLALR